MAGQHGGVASWRWGTMAASHSNGWEDAKPSGQCHGLRSRVCGQASTVIEPLFPWTASYLKRTVYRVASYVTVLVDTRERDIWL